MASSDDEGEPVLHSVTDYNFVDGSDDPVSFSELPVQWSDGERNGGKQKQIFMHGSIDNGLQKIYKQVEAWKFELSNMKPEISLLISKENNWMKLEKPRKSHENIFRTILITLQSLHFLSRNPEASGRALCEHLCKVFRFEPGPCENDLVDHASLISEAVKRDEGLAKAKILTTFLDKDPKKWNFFDKSQDAEASATTKPAFIVDDDIIDETEEAESDDEEQGDKVCAICDNGGDILCCEGKCLRSFHATEEAGLDSDCVSLGFSDEQVEAIQNFYCKNCRYKCHQCFSCGKLGSSDDKSSDCEVFRCVSGECGRFYHPHCVSKMLHPSREFEAKELEGKISSGASFTCPFHKCCVCKQTETEGDPELRFAMCRRCPKSYHKKCLPREIVFDGSDDADDVLPRAWEKLMPKKRILIYCLEHEIDEELATPLRNHIKFPNVRKQASELVSSKEKVPMKKKDLVVGDDSRKRIVKPTIGRDKVCSAAKQGVPLRKGVGKVTEVASSRKTKVKDLSRKPLSKTSSMVKSTQNKRKPSLGLSLFSLMNPGPEPSEDNAAADGEHDQISTVKSVASEASGLPPLEADSESRILALMKDATSSITLSEITEKHKVPSTHAYSSKHAVDRTITMGKVEGSVEALREAVKKLEEGGSIEDAKAVCGPGLLNEMMKWKSKLRVYLAPFLHGMRYTSFGRHFTKIDKLEKVVDKLHWYAEDGDMIVDFCCGANDFSCLMKKKLEDAGKKCYFKNYDVMQPKNDFNFVKRDWMTVDPNELPSGSKLIMGLNPPFGVKSALANKFIDKALKFRPKLIALIVPPETERLDTKDPPYDLVFEDSELLAGKSFYLPGSVDVNDKQMDQWNAKPPPLSFWSRKDWTDKHQVIAKKYADLHTRQEILKRDDTFKDLYTHEYPPEDKRLSKEIPMQSYTTEKAEQRKGTATSVAESHKEGLLSNLGGSGCEINDRRKNQFDEKSIKKCGDENQRLGSGELLQEQKWRRGPDATSLEDKQKKRGSSDVFVEDKQKLKASGEMLQEDKKKIGGSGESSLEKLRQTGPVEIFSEDKNKIGESVKRSVELRKTRTDEISMDKKRKGSHDISPDGKNKRREINEVEVRHDRRGSHEISPDDKKIKGSYEMSPEVRQKVIGSRELSPIGMQNSSFLRRQYQPLETTSLAGIQPEKYQHFDVRVPGSQQFGARYDGVREDAMPYRYEAIHDNHYQSSLYENRISEAQFPGYQREGIDYHGYMPHIENPPCQRSGYFGSHDPRITTPYENFGPATNLSYNRNTTSATQRYAPRLDELNQPRANNIGPDPAFPTGGVYDPRAPRQYLDPNGYPPGPYFRQ